MKQLSVRLTDSAFRQVRQQAHDAGASANMVAAAYIELALAKGWKPRVQPGRVTVDEPEAGA